MPAAMASVAASMPATVIHATTGQPGEDLGGVLEGEIMQQNGDLLRVRPPVFGGADDQRGRHQKLFLETVVRVHPMRAGARFEVVALAGAVADQRAVRVGHAVLGVGRSHAVPVDDCVLPGPVRQIDQETLPRIEEQAGGAVRLADAEDGGGLAHHLQHAPLDGEAEGCRGPCGAHGRGKKGGQAAQRSGRSRGRQETAAGLKNRHDAMVRFCEMPARSAR